MYTYTHIYIIPKYILQYLFRLYVKYYVCCCFSFSTLYITHIALFMLYWRYIIVYIYIYSLVIWCIKIYCFQYCITYTYVIAYTIYMICVDLLKYNVYILYIYIFLPTTIYNMLCVLFNIVHLTYFPNIAFIYMLHTYIYIYKYCVRNMVYALVPFFDNN